MARFINRDYTRTEEDDFKLNVQPQLREHKEAVPQHVRLSDADGIDDDLTLVGWTIQPQYE